MHHLHEIKVRGYHCDVFGHVNHARHLELLEEARWAFFEDRIGVAALTMTDLPLVVVNVNINYRRPAYVNETLVIDTSTKSIGRTSAVLHQHVTLKGTDTEIVDADIAFVAVHAANKKPAPITGELKTLLENSQ